MRGNEKKFWPVLMEFEGYWSNDPDDPGGTTMYGVSSRAYPQYAEQIKNKTLRMSTVFEEVYMPRWQKAKCSELPSGLDICVMDFAYNASPHTSIRLMQQCLNIKYDLQLRMDGLIGPITLKAVEDCLGGEDHYSNVVVERFAAFFNDMRDKYNIALVRKRIWTYSIYYGVSNRINKLNLIYLPKFVKEGKE